MSIIGYIRINHRKQILEQQEFEIKKFAKDKKIKIDKWLKISSRKPLGRHRIEFFLDDLNEGDILIAYEISSFGRSFLEVMHILETCRNKNCQVWTIKENYHFGNDKYSKL